MHKIIWIHFLLFFFTVPYVPWDRLAPGPYGLIDKQYRKRMDFFSNPKFNRSSSSKRLNVFVFLLVNPDNNYFTSCMLEQTANSFLSRCVTTWFRVQACIVQDFLPVRAGKLPVHVRLHCSTGAVRYALKVTTYTSTK